MTKNRKNNKKKQKLSAKRIIDNNVLECERDFEDEYISQLQDTVRQIKESLK